MNQAAVEESTETISGFQENSFRAFCERFAAPDWVQQIRQRGYDAYARLAAEPLDPEEYKRVDLRLFRAEQYNIPHPGSESDSYSFDTVLSNKAEFAGSVARCDGVVTRAQLSEELAQQGVIFGDLQSLAETHQELIEPWLMTKGIDAATDRFSAWHAAFLNCGTVLYVPRGVEIQQPLYSLIGLSQPGAADFSHTLVILEDGASATLLEETACADQNMKALHVGGVELFVGQGAGLKYTQLQNWNEQVYHFAHQMGRVARDGHLQWTVGGLGAKLAHIHQNVELDGRGAHAQVNGVTFARNRQTLSYYTQQTHHAPDTTSDLLYKEVVRDRSRAIWRGMIKVDQDAQLTDGYQRNDALILSEDARVDAIPGLEIEADDVRCTHGATAGQVDEEQVLYCMSRGLSRYEAVHMIVEGFFQQVFDRIPDVSVQETLSKTVEQRLGIGL